MQEGEGDKQKGKYEGGIRGGIIRISYDPCVNWCKIPCCEVLSYPGTMCAQR